MASVRERVSKTDEHTWQVLYRHAGKQKSHTFRDPKKADQFRILVDDIGPDRALAAIADEERWKDALTVDQLADRFLTWKARNVTPRTLTDYRRDHHNWIHPWFGHKAADAITELDVQAWVDHMAARLEPKSVADRHMLLHSMYDFGRARVRRLVEHNPCLETELPRRTRKPPKGTTNPEWRAILDAARAKNPGAGDLVLFLGAIGWRWSEAAALCADSVDDDGDHVWVDVTRVFRMVDHRQILVDDAAKSWAGFRRTRVPSECAAMLRRRLVALGPRDFVFTNSRGRHWNQNTFLRDTWPSLLATAKVGDKTRKPTPHWLRHMAVGNMADAGIPMHEIQRIIGHEHLDTTNNTYGGRIATLSPAGVSRLDAILAGGVPVVAGEVVTSIDEAAGHGERS